MPFIKKISVNLLADDANPFSRGTVYLFNFPEWVGYTFGSIFIAAGVAMLAFWAPKAKRRADQYKVRQLQAYNRKYRAHVTDYKLTGMYLPLGQRFKMTLPVILGVALVLVGIAWIVGNSLTSL